MRRSAFVRPSARYLNLFSTFVHIQKNTVPPNDAVRQRNESCCAIFSSDSDRKEIESDQLKLHFYLRPAQNFLVLQRHLSP
ncbi:hypothetical protein RUM43_001189 [Polyplax serrata]|uniref:Uncharacterized protein n=1 Tax=Polyplax serrata TaxID=468196 RepID=A0AAN8SDF4_POLSC